jgi:hypothetical protein
MDVFAKTESVIESNENFISEQFFNSVIEGSSHKGITQNFISLFIIDRPECIYSYTIIEIYYGFTFINMHTYMHVYIGIHTGKSHSHLLM